MTTLRRFMFTFGALALLCSPAFAQGRGGFGMGMGGGPFMLSNASVQKELKFTEDQTSKAQEVVREAMSSRQEEFQGLRDMEPAERNAKMAELSKAMLEEVTKALALTEAQTKRFHQISLQARGAQAYLDPTVQKDLKITDDQKKEIQELTQAAGAQMREIFQNAGDDRQGAMAKITELNKETKEKVAALLNDDQKKAWKEMVGAPFEMVREPRRDN